MAHEDLAGLLAERCPGDVVVALEACPIDFAENVTKRIIGQAEQELVVSTQFAF